MIIYSVYCYFDCCNSTVEHLFFESESKAECEEFIQAVLKSDESKDIKRYRIKRYRIVESEISDEEFVDDVASGVFI